MTDSQQSQQPPYPSKRKSKQRRDLFETAPISRSIFSSQNQQNEYETEAEALALEQKNRKLAKTLSLQQPEPQVEKIQKLGSCGEIGVIQVKGKEREKTQETQSKKEKDKEKEKDKGNAFIFEGSSDSDDEEAVEQVELQDKPKIIFQDSESHEGQCNSPPQQKQESKKTIELFGTKVQVDSELLQQQQDSKPEKTDQKTSSLPQKPKQLLKSTSVMAENTFAKLKLTRDKSMTGGTTFIVCLEANQRFILACRHVSSQAYILSNNLGLFDENSDDCVGKIKTSFFGNELSLFTRGPNPQKAKQAKTKPRELICTVISHSQQIMQQVKPRDFTVYLLKPGVSYYRDLLGTTMYEEETPLHKLYQDYETNKSKIAVYENRKSKWNQKEKMYSLNMKGRAKLPSIKNFIVESPSEESRDIMLFGKMTENDFSFDIHHPISPAIGMAIALTSFTHKSW